ncbi:MAG: DUF2378 family protein [Archangium sp.]
MNDERSLPVDGSVFDALFRLAKHEGAFGAKLSAIGVGPDASQHRFTAEQWLATLNAFREELHPYEPKTGFRKLGYALAQAYGGTFSGKLIHLALPMLSPMQLLRRWPRFVRVGRADVELEVTELGERGVLIASRDPVDVPMDVNLGLLDFVFELLGETPSFEVEPAADRWIRVTCRW